jgi:exodeoxyribonuclease VII small subunit
VSQATSPPPDAQEFNFESGFARLEEILEKMNSSSVSLDESLKLFEEADKLINACSKKLNDAERSIEMLIKNRSTGELVLGNDKKPLMENFPLPPK